MTALTYVYQVLSYNEATKKAAVEYTPSIENLPKIVKQVFMVSSMTEQQKQIAISQVAPFDEWWAIDPSTRPVPTPGQWQVFPLQE